MGDQTTSDAARLNVPLLLNGPRLGFGCAHLHGGRRRIQSLRLVDAAIDSGVTYFDVARLYGHGAAEGILGEAMRGRRERFFVTSKAGILPTVHPLSQRLRDRAARALRVAPPMRGLVPEPVVPHPEFGVFEPARVRSSVETSLSELQTDHLDLLLLHECRPADATSPALVELLHQLVEEGKIRAWGVATDPSSTLGIVAAPPPGLAALQFAHSVFESNHSAIRQASQLPIILHSTLGAAYARLVAALGISADLRARAQDLGVDPDDTGRLASGMLAAALAENADGVVLFSASSPDHIATNVQALTTPPAEIRAILALVERYRALT
jgi:D-threo-aldose 1-dehydrogenase